jgi:cytochrome c
MVTAWECPEHSLSDSTLDQSPLSREVRLGLRIFAKAPVEAARSTPGKNSCDNCHINLGQRETLLPLVNVAGLFPEYHGRAARLFTVADGM